MCRTGHPLEDQRTPDVLNFMPDNIQCPTFILSPAVRKWKCVTKYFLFNVEWSSKKLWEMISADVKANVKQWIKKLVDVSYRFYKRYLQNLKYNVKRACIFHLILVGYFIELDIVCQEQGEAFLLIKGQNLLSVTKLFVHGPLWLLVLHKVKI